jgi:acyl-CoA reductase-like NAD-dependent aldehyde dehydrogenase
MSPSQFGACNTSIPSFSFKEEGGEEGDLNRAREIARRIRAGMVHVNGKGLDEKSPIGGYRQSGNGRKYGDFGLREFLEVKSIFRYYE